jgi:hypothetical protein
MQQMLQAWLGCGRSTVAAHVWLSSSCPLQAHADELQDHPKYPTF